MKETLLHTEMFLEHQYSTGWAKAEREREGESESGRDKATGFSTLAVSK